MAKNRKNQSAAVRFGPALKMFALCLVVGGVGVGYVNQKNRVILLGESMRKLELRCEKLRHERESLRRQLTSAKSITQLEAQIKLMKLGLVPASPGQIIHVTETPAATGNNERMYAEQNWPGLARQ